MINQESANAAGVYIQVLYRMNKKCFALCGVDYYSGMDYIADALNLMCDIPRIVPYGYDEEKGIHISKGNGLLEFDPEFGYLTEEYI